MKTLLNKKSRLKTAAVLLILLAAITAFRLVVRIYTDTDSLTVLAHENVFYPSVRAFFLASDISDQIVRTDNIDAAHPGQYEIIYQYKLFGAVPLRSKKVIVSVIDTDSPVIELSNSNVVFCRSGSDYAEPEYSVSDNCDSAEQIQIAVEDIDDSTKRLTACDMSGNCSSVRLQYVFGNISEEDFEPGKYRMSDYDKGSVLCSRDGILISEEEFQNIWFIGDSNFMNMMMYESGIRPDRILARYALTPQSMDHPVTYDKKEGYKSALHLITEYQPNVLIIHMGFTAVTGNPLELAESYGKRIDQIRELCPDTQIIVSAITPVTRECELPETQEQINRANYCLLNMCAEKGIHMIDASEILYDQSGYGDPAHYQEDGLHIQGGDYHNFVNYVKEVIEFE